MSDRAVPSTIDDMEHHTPYEEPIKRKRYSKDLEALQIELLKAQRWAKENGERVLILFEGRDAAGKGGSIKRFMEHLNPRGARVVALPKPNETEQSQWYFQRYVEHLPAGGEIVLFDRSWYNRAGVERVMRFSTPRDLARFLREVPDLEASFVDSGIHFFKLWFTVSREEQRRRFASRRDDPLKRWKLSPMDDASVHRFDDYTEARDEMLLATDTQMAPWTIVNSNEKKRARLESIRTVLHALDYDGKDPDIVHEPDPAVVRPASSLDIV
jgi:polyphosphate kinase 2